MVYRQHAERADHQLNRTQVKTSFVNFPIQLELFLFTSAVVLP